MAADIAQHQRPRHRIDKAEYRPHMTAEPNPTIPRLGHQRTRYRNPDLARIAVKPAALHLVVAGVPDLDVPNPPVRLWRGGFIRKTIAHALLKKIKAVHPGRGEPRQSPVEAEPAEDQD